MFAGCILLLYFTACNEENYSEKEYYDYLLYLLSKEDYNVYTAEYTFGEGERVIGHFSVGCGGSLSNPGEIIIELEEDTVLLKKYNNSNFNDIEDFAHILSPDRYTIGSMRVVFPAHNEDQYVRVPITVLSDGLSPDSVYFVPLAIKSVSDGYKVNPEKYNMLFRIALKNEYAEQIKRTQYSMRGNKLNNNLEPTVGAISGNKVVAPVSKSSIRVFAGEETPKKQGAPTAAELTKSTIILTVDETVSDAKKPVKITSYGTIQVEDIEGGSWYEEVKNNMVDDTYTQYFYLRYRYRTLKNPANPGDYNNWVIVEETLKRLF